MQTFKKFQEIIYLQLLSLSFSVLRSPSVEPGSGEEIKPFDQLVLERTKALAQSESIKATAIEGEY